MVLKDGSKMSKSRGNVVDPDLLVEEYGADTVRLFTLFSAPPDKDLSWDDKAVEGAYRFLGRLASRIQAVLEEYPGAPSVDGSQWMANLTHEGSAVRTKIHETIQRVTQDFESHAQLNTAVARLMELLNTLSNYQNNEDKDRPDFREHLLTTGYRALLLLLAPFAPHLSEHLGEKLGLAEIGSRPWPVPDERALVRTLIPFVIQVNGKLRSTISLAPDTSEAMVADEAGKDERVVRALSGQTIVKTVFVPGKILNFVVRPTP